VLAVAVLLAAAFAGALGWRDYSAVVKERATAAAVDAAKTRVADLLSYSSSTLEADLGRAQQQVTGGFRERFGQLANSLIAPSTRERGLTTKATITRAAVVAAQPDQVITLLFINQATTTAGETTPIYNTSQAKVTMARVNSEWLISDVTPI
jgi:Mce-associated membrane protein